MVPDDLLLPDPSEPTEEQPLPSAQGADTGLARTARRSLDAWPFDPLETILLALLYVAPFAMRWLVSP